MWGASRKQMTAVFVCCLCCFLISANLASISALVRAIGSDLSVDYSSVMYVIECSFIASITISPTAAVLSNKYGKRTILMCGLFILIGASVLTAFTSNIQILFLGRFIFGVGQVLIAISSVSIISDMVSNEHLGEAMSMNYAFFSLGAAVGPIFGVWINDLFGWRAISFFVIAFSIVLLFLLRDCENTVCDRDLKIGYLSHILFIVSLSMVFIALMKGAGSSWYMLIAGIVLFIAFIIVQHRSKIDFMDRSILQNRQFLFCIIIALVFYFALYSIDNIQVYRMQIMADDFIFFGAVVSTSVAVAILRMIKPTVQFISAPMISRRCMNIGAFRMTTASMALMAAISVFLLACLLMDIDMSALFIIGIAVFVLLAIAVAVFTPHNRQIIMGSVEPSQRNVASAYVNLFESIGRILCTLFIINHINMRVTDMETFTDAAVMAIAVVVIVCIVSIACMLYRGNRSKV